MTVKELVEQLAKGELDADEFNKRLEEEARAAAAVAAAKEATERDTQERNAAREEARVLTSETAELSRDAERELEESRARIKNAAGKARHI